MLPFFFRHYDSIVDQYFIYDDNSTDDTKDLLSAHPKVHLRSFPRIADSFALSEQSLSNQCWKESIGHADWVIVTDIDEFLYHQDLKSYLYNCQEEKNTLIPAFGYQMISETFPEPDQDLCQSHRLGAPWGNMMKSSIFDPNSITDINFGLGRHRAKPTGRIQTPEKDELLLFHYKYLSFQETFERNQLLKTGLGEIDIQNNWGHKYMWSEKQFRADWNAFLAQAVNTETDLTTLIKSYPIKPWWEKYKNTPKTITEPTQQAGNMLQELEELVKNAVTIEGWRKAEECLEIAKTSVGLPNNPTIVEVGTFMGRTACVLAGALKLSGQGGTVHCVDPFDCSGDSFSIPHYERLLKESGANDLEEIFKHHLNKFGVLDFVQIHRDTSLNTSKSWKQEIDMIILDGDQSIDGAREAYDSWSPFLKPGGTLVLANSTLGKKITSDHGGNRLLVEEELKAPQYTDIKQHGSTAIATKVT